MVNLAGIQKLSFEIGYSLLSHESVTSLDCPSSVLSAGMLIVWENDSTATFLPIASDQCSYPSAL